MYTRKYIPTEICASQSDNYTIELELCPAHFSQCWFMLYIRLYRTVYSSCCFDDLTLALPKHANIVNAPGFCT